MINDSLVKLSREIMLKIRTKANSQTGFTEDQISNLYKFQKFDRYANRL